MTRHPADVLSLFCGLLFAAVGLVLLSGGGGALSLTWVGPLVAIALGALLVLAARSAHRASEGQSPEAER
jgi:hypothetical protein